MMKGHSGWLHTPLGAAIIAVLLAGAFILGYVWHPS